uniref:Uncharacterized protein n=1 Tax=Nelumbo nucifera TaxID=4432 RepID=A0A822XY85_NELNU|nr:TPA_asm: hypothetical protein HUJ06_026784 [Nelumbo nucifera]
MTEHVSISVVFLPMQPIEKEFELMVNFGEFQVQWEQRRRDILAQNMEQYILL